MSQFIKHLTTLGIVSIHYSEFSLNLMWFWISLISFLCCQAKNHLKSCLICTSTYIVLYISLDIYCNSCISYFDIFPHLIFSTSCILYIGHHSWHMVGSVLTYSGLSALHKKLSQKLVNLPSTNAGCQVHKKVENSAICKWSKTFVFCYWLGLVLLALVD